MHDADQFLDRDRCLGLRWRFDHFFTQVVLDHLGDKPVHGASIRCRLLKQFAAWRVMFDGRTLQSIDLTVDATQSLHEFDFFYVGLRICACSHTPRGISDLCVESEISCGPSDAKANTIAIDKNRSHTKDAMNPRSNSQSPEGDSRRFSFAAVVPMGWIRAWEDKVSAEVSAIRR